MSSEACRVSTVIETLGLELLRFGADDPIDARIAVVSEAQHGPISVVQLQACGLGGSGARRRAQRGQLHRLHRGVYVPGRPRVGPRGRVAGALLACGQSASASHITGAWLRELRGSTGVVHVTVSGLSGRRHGGEVVCHSARRLRPQDVEIVDGLPVTSMARTLLDCAPGLGRRGTEKLVAEAEHLGTFDLAAAHDLLAHLRGHPGRGSCAPRSAMRLGRAGGRRLAPRTVCERRCARTGPSRSRSATLLSRLAAGCSPYADFLYRSVGLIVEVDPLGTHNTTASYRSDRRRDRATDRLGYQTMRFSDQDLEDLRACAIEVLERHEFRARAARNS